jgi:hypothetical protein
VKPTAAAISAEADALDAITIYLDRPANRRGRTAAEISADTGLARGRVDEILKKSSCVLKRRSHNKQLWWNDWSDLDDVPQLKPKRKQGRPKKHKAGS